MSYIVAKSVVKNASKIALDVGTNVATKVTTVQKPNSDKFEKLSCVTSVVGGCVGGMIGAYCINDYMQYETLDGDIEYNCLEYGKNCTLSTTLGIAVGAFVGYGFPLAFCIVAPLFALNYAGITVYDVVKKL